MAFQNHHLRVVLLISLLSVVFITSCSKKTAALPPPPPPAAPPPPAPQPTITLRATPGTVERGTAVALQWETTNAGSVRIEPGIGDVATTGNRAVTPNSSVTYIATAIGPGGSASDSARITVNAAPAPPAEAPPPKPAVVDSSTMFDRNMKTIFFDYDKSEIRPDQLAQLRTNAEWLKQNPTVRFQIQGHCDERGSQEYNLALGDHRANAVKEYLVQQGIAGNRMSIISYGEEKPMCRETTEACMGQNRRAEFAVQP
jgi:peptidoglycan-associated lipoprotein